MDPKYLPHLTDDELTYELSCRGLPDCGSSVENRNVREAILTTSLATSYPVRPPNPKDAQTEYVVCVDKLRELSSTIVTLGSSPDSNFELVHARLEYVKSRIDRITVNQLKTVLMILWSQTRGEFNSKRSAFRDSRFVDVH